MKNNINSIKKNTLRFFLILMTLASLSSCENEFDSDKNAFDSSNNPPIIASVSEAREDKPVTQGVLESSYIVRGENLSSISSVTINNYPALISPALGTDNLIFIRVPENAPYLNQSNILRIENSAGYAEYDFSLLTITEFTEDLVDGKNVVNLMGGDFTETKSVTFVSGSEEDGNLVERPADFTIISPSMVQAVVPAGVEQAFIFLETNRGAIAQSDSYGFSYAIYVDEPNPDVVVDLGWAGMDIASTTQALGSFSIQATANQWDAAPFSFTENPISTSEYSTMVVKIYANQNVTSLRIAFNRYYVDDIGYIVDLEPGWNNLSIPLNSDDFWPNGTEEEIVDIVFQEFSRDAASNAPYVFYIDDFGLL